MLSCRPILAQPVLLLGECFPDIFYRRETGFCNYALIYLVTIY
jgi:hypothetical protein